MRRQQPVARWFHPVAPRCETLSATTPTAHIADLVTGTGGFATHQVSSLKRWLNRMKIRFSRLS
ncbi:MAG: hypothetical protein MZV70_17095 [Desulfobacterales bacterium]|nr:hypothetical protein [Desulfobacterales bacterium]